MEKLRAPPPFTHTHTPTPELGSPPSSESNQFPCVSQENLLGRRRANTETNPKILGQEGLGQGIQTAQPLAKIQPTNRFYLAPMLIFKKQLLNYFS